YWVEDAVLLPPPGRRVPLMVGGVGPRLLAAALPHAYAWNVWFSTYGNDPDGFARLVERGRPGVQRRACVLAAVAGGAGARPHDPDAPPVEHTRLAAHLRELADAGADEAILVADPITERSVRALAEAL